MMANPSTTDITYEANGYQWPAGSEGKSEPMDHMQVIVNTFSNGNPQVNFIMYGRDGSIYPMAVRGSQLKQLALQLLMGCL